MLQLRKKLLVGALCAGMLLSAGQSAWSEPVDGAAPVAEDTAAATGEAADSADVADAPAASITEEQALSSMQKYAETDELELYVDPDTGIFAVKLSNGSYIWSNPFNSDNDPNVKSKTKRDELKSSMVVSGVKVTDTEAPNTTLRTATNGSTKVEKVDGGFKATVTFSNEGITIPYFVTLEDDHFNISIDSANIVEVEIAEPDKIKDATRSIVDIGLFQDLGAAYCDEEGYIVIPDGSGAVINFNNGKTNANEYTQKIYGKDLAVSQDMAPKKTEQAYLPILGLVKNDYALLEVVTEGAANATARAAVAGQRATGYNSAWFNFTLRTTDTYYMGGSNASALKAYQQKKIPDPRLTVSYYPIAKSGATYTDIGLRYQQYLIEEQGLTKKTTANQSPFYLDVFGGTVKERSVLGFPVKLQTAATTYEQAKYIAEQFAARGVDNIVFTYNDFNKAGITSKMSNKVDYSGKLGGKDDFIALKNYIEGSGGIFAPSVDLMEYEKSGNGYSKTGASVIGVTKAYATQGAYELAFGTPHQTRNSWYILTPAYFEKVYGQVISSFTSEGIGAINVADGTKLLYSDFSGNDNKSTTRQQAADNLKSCYQMINNSGMTFVANACNDYALPYVDYLKDVPLYSSNFDISDYDIPLYEIVIHGYIPYTTKAKNASSGADELFLLSVATGTPVHYEVMYQNPNEFTDCEYDTLFYSYYEGWLDIAAREYQICKDVVAPLSEKTITDFRYLSEKVVQTTFSDGTVITADLAALTLKVNGTEYNLKGATTD
ncbi:MAG: hypothetical protein KIG62_00950 [Oscillospiraceae bacterium]|nr:hypothetical protein [Oscillospiraceae bacterium]